MIIEFEDILKGNYELIELVRNWRNSKNVNQYMYTNHHISKEEHQKWIEDLRVKNTAKAWIIKYNEKPIGLVSLSDIDYENKITDWGFYIADESARGKGVGSAALYKLMEYVFDEMNFNKMYTKVLENNRIAIKLYEKFGFKKEGKLKKQLLRDEKYIDVIIMGIFKEDWKNIKDQYKTKYTFTSGDNMEKKIKNSSTRIYGKRIYLRGLQEEDVSEEYCNWLNDPMVNKFLETKKTTINELKNYIKEKKESKNCLFFGIFIKNSNKHVGNIKLEPIDFRKKKATLGILIGDKNYWGQGLCTEAVKLVVDYAFKNLNLKRVELGVISENKAAIQCYLKAGFKIDRNKIIADKKESSFLMSVEKTVSITNRKNTLAD